MLRGVREEARGGAYTLVLEFETKEQMTFDMWESRLGKIQAFFGPGISAEVRAQLCMPPPCACQVVSWGHCSASGVHSLEDLVQRQMRVVLVMPPCQLRQLMCAHGSTLSQLLRASSINSLMCTFEAKTSVIAARPTCPAYGLHSLCNEHSKYLCIAACTQVNKVDGGVDVYLITDGSGAGRGGAEQKDVLPPLMPGLKARQQ